MNAPPTIIQALSSVMEDVRAVGKTGHNSHGGYDFRGIDAVVNAVSPVLRKHSVVVVPNLISRDYQQIAVGAKGSLMGHMQVTVEYTFYGPAGDHISATVAGEAFDSGDKATPKAMSVAFRTALLQSLALPTTESDPDDATYERSSEVASDQQWLTNVLSTIAQASDIEGLKAIGPTIDYGLKHDKCSPADRVALGDAWKAREAELVKP